MRSRSIAILTLLFVLFFKISFCQNKADTNLLNAYLAKEILYEYDYPDSVLKYAQLHLNEAYRQNSLFHQARANTFMGLAKTKMYQFNDALIYYLKAREITEKCKCADESSNLGQIGYIYLRLGRTTEAYKYFKLQQAKSVEEENYLSFLNCIINLSDYYNSKSMIDSAYSVLKLGLITARKHKTRDKEAVILDNIANYFYTKAIETNDDAYLAQVKRYCDTALKFHYMDRDSGGIYYIHGLLGAMHAKLKNYNEAESYYKSYMNYSYRTGDVHNIRYSAMEASDVFAEQGKFEIAYKYRVIYDSINRVYLDKEVVKQVDELNKKYEIDKKEQENKVLTISNEKKQIGIYFGLGTIAILLGMFIFIFRNFKQKQRANILISKQKGLLEEKQKEIVDSIHYAKRIQTTILAHRDFITENLKDNLIYFNPKDIVSGDFYWATKKDDYFYLAVCDSTGHGVPGAFMSLLNIGFLSEAINEKNITAPNLVFDHVRDRLEKSVSKEGQKDGFDGVLLRLNIKTKKMDYSAANVKPVIVSKKGYKELETNRMPVGIGERKEPFSLHTIELRPDETLYLYTDGFADQFGGPRGKKFKYKQLNELLVTLSEKDLKEQELEIERVFQNWKGDLEQVDDICLIGIRNIN